MHRIAQVVQQLANDLPLVLLLYTDQDGGIGRRAGCRRARFQVVFSSRAVGGGTNSGAREFPRSLKKLPTSGKPKRASRWEK
jgi:hypothetical protein